MVQIGRAVKYDDYGRVTLPSVLAELMNLEKGQDEVRWYIVDGKAIIEKVTKVYAGGFDPESEEIYEALRSYEVDQVGEPEEDMDPEEMEARAREQYARDKAARQALKQAKKN